ncbi:MAG: hypothetical protein ACK55I_15590, partial [bacterium]
VQPGPTAGPERGDLRCRQRVRLVTDLGLHTGREQPTASHVQGAKRPRPREPSLHVAGWDAHRLFGLHR